MVGRQAKPPPPKPNNPLRNRKPIVNAPPTILRQAVATAQAQAKKGPTKRACPNKTCDNPNVVDGICHNCGTVVDDSNIVSEVQFGEGSNGAAVVQGSFVSADQGAAKSLGPAFRRAGGMEDRESTVREGRRLMQAMAAQLEVNDPAVQAGLQIFKLAAMNNFIQGRRMDMVAAVCLYSAARKERPCRVMLIDFADKVQVNVFKLGGTFKALHRQISIAKDGILPVIPEDLIYRFASKLDFGSWTGKVAEDAVRLVQRMSLDWMVMGRRPSGVCGACLILAARMNNFRRTVTEVVYIVKVTTATLQKRLDEFKETPSASLSIDEFLSNEFLESAHDPPSFYEKTAEFQSRRKKRKRRKDLDRGEDEENSGSEDGGSPSKRQRTMTPAAELRRDADGFAIPPPPLQPQDMPTTSNTSTPPSSHSQDIPIDPELAVEGQSGETEIEDQAAISFEKLVEQFQPEAFGNDGSDDDTASINSGTTSTSRRRTSRTDRPIVVPEGWSQIEDQMVEEMDEMINDPHTVDFASNYARAQKRAAAHMIMLEKNNPQKPVNMDVHIGEDEFADDPEVRNCMNSAEDVKRKERIWVNENRSWLRKQQVKEWQKRQAENGPPKAKRNRKKKPRIGEGQTSAASTPAEATTNLLKQRSYSKKINYQAIQDMFAATEKSGGSRLGSAATSRVTSRAGSVSLGSDAGSESAASQSEAGTPAPRSPPRILPTTDDDDEEGDEDDYVQPTPAKPVPAAAEDEDEDDWRAGLQPTNEEDAEAALDRLDEDVSDYGSVDAGGLGDDFDEVGGGYIEDDIDDGY